MFVGISVKGFHLTLAYFTLLFVLKYLVILNASSTLYSFIVLFALGKHCFYYTTIIADDRGHRHC